MKKIISFILALYCAILFAYNVFAFSAVVNVENASGKPGDKVSIPVEISSNPGFAAFDITLKYDKTLFELTDLRTGNVLQPAFCAPNKSSGMFSVMNINDIFENGTLFVAEFQIKENISSGTYNVSVDCGMYNEKTNPINISVNPGYIKVLSSSVPGDINNDGKVNNTDVIALFNYVSGFDVGVDTARLDTDGNGAVDNKDVVRLFQYVSKVTKEIY